jgi:hypothetical protein
MEAVEASSYLASEKAKNPELFALFSEHSPAATPLRLGCHNSNRPFSQQHTPA